MAIADADRRVLAPLFGKTQWSTDVAPSCEVLFVYAKLDTSGNIEGQKKRIRDFAKDAGAHMVVVALDNPGECCMKALDPKNDWYANFTVALDRKEEQLAFFFKALFVAMFAGHSMLNAWVKLAPQGPGQNPDLPVMFMAAEAGHIVFAR